MELSPKEKDFLRARYEVWGLAGARAKLAREEHDPLAPPAVTAFAREWVAAEEAKFFELVRNLKITAIVGAALLTMAMIAVAVTRSEGSGLGPSISCEAVTRDYGAPSRSKASPKCSPSSSSRRPSDLGRGLVPSGVACDDPIV